MPSLTSVVSGVVWQGMVVDFHYVLCTKSEGYGHSLEPGDIAYHP